VLLGIDELAVSWRQQGTSFITEVPPQGGEGPWIVRVEVEDQYGHLLGRDFVEISRTPALPPAPSPVAPAPAAAPAQASR
jgi:hypothetical protein